MLRRKAFWWGALGAAALVLSAAFWASRSCEEEGEGDEESAFWLDRALDRGLRYP